MVKKTGTIPLAIRKKGITIEKILAQLSTFSKFRPKREGGQFIQVLDTFGCHRFIVNRNRYCVRSIKLINIIDIRPAVSRKKS